MIKKILILVLFVFTCGKQNINERLVYVSILPQKQFVQKIGGNEWIIRVMVGPGHNPSSYSPSPEQIKGLYEARLYLEVGHLPFEKFWLRKQKNNYQNINFINLSERLDLISIGENHKHSHEEVGYNHESAHDYPENEIDPHVWLSPKEVKKMSEEIYQTLLKMDSSKKEYYQENYLKWCHQIDSAQHTVDSLLKDIPSKAFIVYHPSWGYFARDFHFEQIPIEYEGKEPNPEYLKKIIDTAKEKDIKLMIIQKQFDISKAEFIAEELGIKILSLDPLAENWEENLVYMAESIREALNE